MKICAGSTTLLIVLLAPIAAAAQSFFNYWNRCTDTTLPPERRIEYCTRLVDNGGGPNSEVAVLTVLGGLYRIQHDYQKSIESYSRAVNYESLGIADKTENVISRGSLIALPSAEVLIGAFEGRAEVYALTGRTDLALADTAEIFKLAPGAAISFAVRCRIRAIAKIEPDKALADCATAMKLAPGDTQVLGAAGLLQYQLGHMRDAADDFGRALAIDPKLPGALYMRGVLAFRTGNPAAGNGDIAAAKEEDPTIDHNFSDLGIAP